MLTGSMACMKLGSKSDSFKRQGQDWFCTTGLPSDIIIEVGEMSFHLHKFPLLSRSGVMERRIAEASKEGDDKCLIQISDFPGRDKTFELVAKFCYGVKLELTASNVVCLRCAAKHLEMTEEYGEGNLISQTGKFFNQVVFKSWKYSIKALQCCDEVLKYADEFNITKKCIESLAMRALADPNSFVEHGGGPMQSPGGSVLWNGISTGARREDTSSDWWYEDASMLSFALFKRLITLMDSRGIREEIVAGSLTYYTRKYLPVLKRRHSGSSSITPLSSGSSVLLSEEEQKHLLEEIQELDLPCMQKGLLPTKFFVDMLIIAKILKASPSCIENLEKRIGMQLDQATLEDLVMPSFSHTMETLYDVDSVQRILDYFLSRVHTMPHHPWLAETEREDLCRLLDCQKLSTEACTHAAQNERLPLRIIVQVLFIEQLQLKASVAECLPVLGSLDGRSRKLGSNGFSGESTKGGWETAVRENQDLKVGMDKMRMRVCELEKECSKMRQEIEKLDKTTKGGGASGSGSKTWENVSKKLGFGMKLKSHQIDSAQKVSSLKSNNENVKIEKLKDVKERQGKY
uniref:NPH3 domain-containing protein n=1 Tax=Brassica campestris TaxID=3711 RepID=M4E9I4_BRACM